MIKEFITDVCELLEIRVPKISYDTHFATKTTLAQCEPETNTIYLNKVDKPNPDYVFSIAHELRHIYQYQIDEKFYLSGYKPSNKCSSVEEYNLQIAEVDANAFASIVMSDFFSIKPQWNGLSNKVIDAIEKRIKLLLTTEFSLEI
jgi:Zn-dependent peptidase ImmA (M78 family)